MLKGLQKASEEKDADMVLANPILPDDILKGEQLSQLLLMRLLTPPLSSRLFAYHNLIFLFQVPYRAIYEQPIIFSAS